MRGEATARPLGARVLFSSSAWLSWPVVLPVAWWVVAKRPYLTHQTVLILKYILNDYAGYIYYGAANVGMNAGIMIA
jgi:hypothetical protein